VDQPSWAGAWGNSPRTCCAPTGSASQADAAVVVPADSYFVLGDNPALSVDSRSFGWVTAAQLTAPVLFRIWPPGPLADPPTLRPTA
jgi:signal peptidase I